MKAIRTFFVFVTLLAVAVAPAAAALRPCCCTLPPPTSLVANGLVTGHESREALSADRPCCAETRHETTDILHEVVHGAGCCCLQSPPESTPVVPRVSLVDVPPNWIVAELAAPDSTLRGCCLRTALAAEVDFAPSGVPLLALYCTWLK